MEGRKRPRRRSLVVSKGAKQRLTRKLLRTMAAVPPGQSVVALADDDLVRDLDRLGFTVDQALPEKLRVGSSYDWGIVNLENTSWIESIELAVGISDKIRDGGWIFVGTVDGTFRGTQLEAAEQLTDAIGNGLAVAEEVTVVDDETRFAVSAILRRVSARTPP